jgi:hypothetical protein
MQKAKEAVQNCTLDASLPASEAIAAMAACLEKRVNATLEVTKEEIDFQSNVRKDMGKKLASYDCGNTLLNTSKPVRNSTWDFYDAKEKNQERNERFTMSKSCLKLISAPLFSLKTFSLRKCAKQSLPRPNPWHPRRDEVSC